MLVDDQPEAKVEPSPLTREIEKSFRHRYHFFDVYTPCSHCLRPNPELLPPGAPMGGLKPTDEASLQAQINPARYACLLTILI